MNVYDTLWYPPTQIHLDPEDVPCLVDGFQKWVYVHEEGISNYSGLQQEMVNPWSATLNPGDFGRIDNNLEHKKASRGTPKESSMRKLEKIDENLSSLFVGSSFRRIYSCLRRHAGSFQARPSTPTRVRWWMVTKCHGLCLPHRPAFPNASTEVIGHVQ